MAEAQDAGDVQNLSVLSVGFAALLVGVQAFTSFHVGLGLHWQLLLAAVRCVLQLSVLGYILVPIFNCGSIWPVLGYSAFMMLVSTKEAVGRPQRKYNGMFLQTLIIIVACASLVMAYATFVILQVHPWWTPQYLIPILGMVLGNTISGISLGLVTTVEEFISGADRIERLLALGATRWEASRDLLVRATKTAMTPLLNQMSVVGLVSIPGMMTGQILAGSDPAQAARYQMVIMFMLSAASTLGAIASIYACVGAVLDSCHRLRLERLLPTSSKGLLGHIGAGFMAVASRMRRLLQLLCCCCTPVRHSSSGPSTTGTAAAAGKQLPGHAAAAAAASDSEGLTEPLLGGPEPPGHSPAATSAAAAGSEGDEEKGGLGSSGSMVDADRSSQHSDSSRSSIVVVTKQQ